MCRRALLVRFEAVISDTDRISVDSRKIQQQAYAFSTK